jgi:hypothetical protein
MPYKLGVSKGLTIRRKSEYFYGKRINEKPISVCRATFLV